MAGAVTSLSVRRFCEANLTVLRFMSRFPILPLSQSSNRVHYGHCEEQDRWPLVSLFLPRYHAMGNEVLKWGGKEFIPNTAGLNKCPIVCTDHLKDYLPTIQVFRQCMTVRTGVLFSPRKVVPSFLHSCPCRPGGFNASCFSSGVFYLHNSALSLILSLVCCVVIVTATSLP